MFRKIEIWILYLVVVIGLIFSLIFGALVRQELAGKKLGWFSKTALAIAEMPREISILVKFVRGDGLALDKKFPAQIGFEGKPNQQQAYLLLSRYDKGLQEGVVELVDLTNFDVLHTWNPDIDYFNSMVEKEADFKFLDRDQNNRRALLLHPLLMPDGGLVFSRGPLRKINACSDLIFQVTNDFYHHSVEVDIDGNIWASSYLNPRTYPENEVGEKSRLDGGYSEDAIVKLTPTGKILFEKSVSQIFEENGLEYLLNSIGTNFNRDPTHLNDIQPVYSDSKHWKQGDVFLVLSHQSMVVLYRPSLNKIIWKGTGKYFHPHDVDVLNDSQISVFNNNAKFFFNGSSVDGHNEIIVYDFDDDKYFKYMKNSLIQTDVRTTTQGRARFYLTGIYLLKKQIMAGRCILTLTVLCGGLTLIWWIMVKPILLGGQGFYTEKKI